jgi:leucyl/phenylalanyl-tRNA---protein transferase
VPIETGPCEYAFPPAWQWALDEDLVAVGADWQPPTLIAGYRRGLFPMPHKGANVLWFSPIKRGVLPLDGMYVSRSLRRSERRFTTTFNQAFREVIQGCADPGRPHGWITEEVIQAYCRLHELGWAHSVEVWSEVGELVGGLYGVELGGLFAAESKFSRARDSSKVAVAALVQRLAASGDGQYRLLDVQWSTPHLVSLGVVEIPRQEYLERLSRALRLPACFD